MPLGEWLSQQDILIIRFSHLSYDEIARKLDMSPRTVKAHTEEIKKKLGVNRKRHIQDRCRQLRIDWEEDR